MNDEKYVFLNPIEEEKMWKKSSESTYKKIHELQKEMGAEWIKKIKITTLVKELEFINKDIEEIKKNCDDDSEYRIKELKEKYKSKYLELGRLRTEDKDEKLSKEEIQRLRKIPIEKFLNSGDLFDAGGGRKKVCCPLPGHNEKTPSFVIYPDNSWHCFGCSAHGYNAIDFIMKRDGVGFYDALNYLK